MWTNYSYEIAQTQIVLMELLATWVFFPFRSPYEYSFQNNNPQLPELIRKSLESFSILSMGPNKFLFSPNHRFFRVFLSMFSSCVRLSTDGHMLFMYKSTRKLFRQFLLYHFDLNLFFGPDNNIRTIFLIFIVRIHNFGTGVLWYCFEVWATLDVCSLKNVCSLENTNDCDESFLDKEFSFARAFHVNAAFFLHCFFLSGSFWYFTFLSKTVVSEQYWVTRFFPGTRFEISFVRPIFVQMKQLGIELEIVYNNNNKYLKIDKQTVFCPFLLVLFF